MSNAGLGAKLRYRFDNIMARGNVAVIALLGVISLGWVVIAGLVAWIFKVFPLDEDNNAADYDVIEATWRQLTFTLDPGTFSGDLGWGWRLLSLLTTLFGVLVVASLIGVVSAAFDDQITKLRKGKSSVIESGHTVILGWNPKVFTIISELVVANESERRPAIVILADRDRVDMEDEIREKVGSTANTRVICRSGDPLDQDEVLRANPFEAKSIIVLSDDESTDPDATTIKTALALTNHVARPESDISIVGEIRHPSNLGVAQLVGKHEAQWILPLETISKLTVQTCRQSGLSRVYSELLQFEGDEMYFTEQPSLVGKTYLECQYHFATSTVVGIVSDDHSILNPPVDRVLAEGEQLIVIAEDDSTIELAEPVAPDKSKLGTVTPGPSAAERTLIVGSHSQLPLILEELSEYSPAGSQVTVVSDKKLPKLGTYANLAVDRVEGDTTERELLISLEPHSYDHILVLAYRDHLDIETADSRTLITLLHLRELAAEYGQDFNIVSEMLDDRNRRLAEITKADDFIVSDNLISRMMAQISENAELNEIYSGLFSADGAEIYLRPASWYVQLHTPVDFYTVLEGAARRNETAIGYRERTPSTSGDGNAKIRINPPKTEQRVYDEDDLIIVFAED